MKQRPPPVSDSRTGFTLVELLVVVAIIALITGVLLPVVVKLRDNARAKPEATPPETAGFHRFGVPWM